MLDSPLNLDASFQNVLSAAFHISSHSNRWRPTYDDDEDEDLPEPRDFTLGSHKSKNLVPDQREYRGPFAIPNNLANKLCSAFDVKELLKILNDILGTSFSMRRGDMRSRILETFSSSGADFGIMYATLRPFWDNMKISDIQDLWNLREDNEKRWASIDRYMDATWLDMPPRRVWDLYSNRVVHYCVVNSAPYFQLDAAVSHAWVASDDRQTIHTPINGYQWAVQVPRGTSLESVRIELLNFGFQYVWLDVLCLRQGKDNNIKKSEHKTDVPTIGNVYQKHAAATVCYYSGLGRPFIVDDLKDLDHELHWLNRAWTLQEIHAKTHLIAGTNDYSPNLSSKARGRDRTITARFNRAWVEYKSFFEEPTNIVSQLQIMRRRHATNEVDKIAGLAYLLKVENLPTYCSDQEFGGNPEVSWSYLVEVLDPQVRAGLLFYFPAQGHGTPGSRWFPTWDQIQETPRFPDVAVYVGSVILENEEFYYDGPYIHRCRIEELDQLDGVDWEGDDVDWEGDVFIQGGIGYERRFRAWSRDAPMIRSGWYTLLGSTDHKLWVVGWIDEDGFHKLSILNMEVPEKARRKLDIEFRKTDLA